MDHLWTDYQNHDFFGGMSSLFIPIEVLKKIAINRQKLKSCQFHLYTTHNQLFVIIFSIILKPTSLKRGRTAKLSGSCFCLSYV